MIDLTAESSTGRLFPLGRIFARPQIAKEIVPRITKGKIAVEAYDGPGGIVLNKRPAGNGRTPDGAPCVPFWSEGIHSLPAIGSYNLND